MSDHWMSISNILIFVGLILTAFGIAAAAIDIICCIEIFDSDSQRSKQNFLRQKNLKICSELWIIYRPPKNFHEKINLNFNLLSQFWLFSDGDLYLLYLGYLLVAILVYSCATIFNFNLFHIDSIKVWLMNHLT